VSGLPRDGRILVHEEWRILVPGKVKNTCTWKCGEYLYLERCRKLVLGELLKLVSEMLLSGFLKRIGRSPSVG